MEERLIKIGKGKKRKRTLNIFFFFQIKIGKYHLNIIG